MLKKLHLMTMDELLNLPSFTEGVVFERAQTFGGCFRDPTGHLWGTCLIEDPWKRYAPAWVRFTAASFVAFTELRDEHFRQSSTLQGFIDQFDGAMVAGWAQDRMIRTLP